MRQQPEGTPSIGTAPPVSPGASDADLLQAIAGGNEAAFEELWRRYGRAVASVCRRVADGEREDCEQEVLARIWRKAALFDPARGSAAAWLLSLARRTALNSRRRHRPSRLPFEDVREPAVDPPDVDVFWLGAALTRLSERERTVIELAYYSDLSDGAIARRLQVPLGSVKSWKRRGLNRLASLLGDEVP